MSEWIDIETAPSNKDVLLYFPAKVTGAYKQNTLSPMMKIGRAHDFPNRMPTHWMPLPSPPTD